MLPLNGDFELKEKMTAPLQADQTHGRDLPSADDNSKTSRLTSYRRVLHLINGEHYSGAERVQDLLALRLPEFGFELAFACVKPGSFPEMRKSQKSSLHRVPMRSKFDLSAAWSIATIARRDRHLMLHAHTPRTALIGRIASRLAGLPLVYHVHSPVGRDSTRGWANWMNTWMERWSIAGASHLITVSQSLARYMRAEQHVDTRSLTVVPNGVPVATSVPTRKSPNGPWTIGTVALFRPRKGAEVLLDAMAILVRRGQPVRLLAVGPFESPEYELEIKNRVLKHGLADSIEWTGFTQDVNQQLQRMDLFILPSLFGEGLPMVVLEAMAMGVPTVATNVEGIPEAIRDGQDGIICQPNDPEGLAASIEQVVTGAADWSSLRNSCQQRHADSFSDRSMAEGIARVYQKVLA